MAKDYGAPPGMADRMRLLRLAMGAQTQTEWAIRIGVTLARWNNVERGYPVSNALATTLVRTVPGLTFDWVFNGNASGLPMALYDRLQEAAVRERKKANNG